MASEIGSATFGLVVGLGRFKKDLAKAETAAESTGDNIADDLVDKPADQAEKGSGRFKTAMLALGAAGGAAVVAGFTSALEFGAAEDRLGAQLGLSEAEAARLGDVAGRIYGNNFGDSVGHVNEALKSVVQNLDGMGDAADADLERVSTKVLALSDTFDQDLNMTTAAAANLIRNGLANDADEALDIITRGLQDGTNKADDLLETFNEYGPQFSQLGLTGQQALGLMSQGLQAGARDADTVADALKEFAIRAQDGSTLTAESFAAIGLSAEEMSAAVAAGGPAASAALDSVLDGLRGVDDPAMQAQIAVGLFGTKAEDLQDSLYALDLDSAATGLGEVEGAAQNVADTVGDNAASTIESFRRKSLMKLSDFLGTTVIPKLEGIADWAKDNPTAFKIIAGVIGGVLVTAFAAWAVQAGIAAAATIAATWPILLIAAIVAIVAALIVTHWDTIKTKTGEAWEWVKTKTGEAWEWVKTKIGEIAEWLVNLFLNWTLPGRIIKHWDTIKTKTGEAWEWVKSKISGVVDWIKGVPESVGSALLGIWDGLIGGAKSAINTVIGLWNGLSIPSVTIGGWDPLGDFGPSIPSVTIGGWDLPNIPYLHDGGIVPGPPGAEVLTMLEAGERVTAREQVAREGGSTGGTEVIQLVLDGRVVTEVVRDRQADLDRRNGRRPGAGAGRR